MKYNLSGGRQKIRIVWQPPEEKSFLAATRGVFWRPPGGGGFWRPPEELRGSVKNNLELLYMRQTTSSRGCFCSNVFWSESDINACVTIIYILCLTLLGNRK